MICEQKEMLELYQDMVNILNNFLFAKEACDKTLESMKKFSYSKRSFDSEILEFMELMDSTAFLQDTINKLLHRFEKIEDIAKENDFSEVDSLVYKLYYLQGIPLTEVSERTGYSYGYIRRVSSKLKNIWANEGMTNGT